jgi:CheY-like chemotaxis protein
VTHRRNFNSLPNIKEKGQVAIDDLNTIKFDLIILDMVLPVDRFGYEIAEFIRYRCQINRGTPIIGVSREWGNKIYQQLGYVNMYIYDEKKMAEELVLAIQFFVVNGHLAG